MSGLRQMRTEATSEEIKWHRRLVRLWKSKPDTMEGFADGTLSFVEAGAEIEDVEHFQPLSLSGNMECEGGDPWT